MLRVDGLEYFSGQLRFKVPEQDPLAEEVCRALMHLHLGNSDSGEALAVYRRLRDELARSIRSMPSSETVQLETRLNVLHAAERKTDLQPLNQYV